MAVAVEFLEQNNWVTPAGGERYPVWVREARLGKLPVIEVVSVWQMNDAELAMIEETGIVFIRVVGGQPPVQIVGADPVEFEGQNKVYKHPACRDLPTYERDIVHNGIQTIDITSAWQLNRQGLADLYSRGGCVTLLVTGGQPTVEVFGFNPIK